MNYDFHGFNRPIFEIVRVEKSLKKYEIQQNILMTIINYTLLNDDLNPSIMNTSRFFMMKCQVECIYGIISL